MMSIIIQVNLGKWLAIHHIFLNDYELRFYFIEICLNNKSPHGRTIVLSVNKQNKIYTLQNKLYFDHKSNKVCDENRNTTVQIRFMFYCGYEVQIPKVAKNNCTTNVLSINPEMCDEKVCIFYLFIMSQKWIWKIYKLQYYYNFKVITNKYLIHSYKIITNI